MKLIHINTVLNKSKLLRWYITLTTFKCRRIILNVCLFILVGGDPWTNTQFVHNLVYIYICLPCKTCCFFSPKSLKTAIICSWHNTHITSHVYWNKCLPTSCGQKPENASAEEMLYVHFLRDGVGNVVSEISDDIPESCYIENR